MLNRTFFALLLLALLPGTNPLYAQRASAGMRSGLALWHATAGPSSTNVENHQPNWEREVFLRYALGRGGAWETALGYTSFQQDFIGEEFPDAGQDRTRSFQLLTAVDWPIATSANPNSWSIRAGWTLAMRLEYTRQYWTDPSGRHNYMEESGRFFSGPRVAFHKPIGTHLSAQAMMSLPVDLRSLVWRYERAQVRTGVIWGTNVAVGCSYTFGKRKGTFPTTKPFTAEN